MINPDGTIDITSAGWHEVDGLWFIFKPAGLASQPVADPAVDDVLNWAHTQHGLPRELAPCHRLDRATSGVLVCAISSARRADVGRWFQDSQVHKTYRALVHGRAPRGGTVSRSLHDRRRGRKMKAVTRFRRTDVFPGVTYLTVTPETGRRHQIRRHLRGLGFPIWGDARYGSVQEDPEGPARLWLHAESLALPGGLRVRAGLPLELAQHLASLTELRERTQD
jgi:23S rRNA-/tRNA-specific pseudouridylate synthase